MFGLSLGHIIVVVVIILLFGSKRIPGVAGALGKGLRNFKKGLSGDEELDKSSGHKVEDGVKDPDEILPKDK